MPKISQEIDRLTNSIVNVVTGDSFDTEVLPIDKTELKLLKKSGNLIGMLNYQRVLFIN